jgi:NitT/TauT family transport system substrate-binding protein
MRVTCWRRTRCALLALFLFLQACTPAVVETPEPEEANLRVLVLPFLSFAPFFIAEEEGYFAEQALEVEFVRMEGSVEAIPALAQGDLDVVAGTLNVGLLSAISRGSSVRFVADKGYFAPTGCTATGFLARRTLIAGGELNSPAQMKGRRLAMDVAKTEGYFLETLLEPAGLTLDDVIADDLPSPVLSEALERGTIDIAHVSEPWITRILRAGHAELWMRGQEIVPDFQFAVVSYGPTLLDERRDIGNRFMVAYLKAVRRYNEGKTERNVEILAEHAGLDPELLKQACWPSLRDDGSIDVQSVLDFQGWAVEKGYLDDPIAEDQFWDPSFVEYANQVLDASSQ